MKSLVSILALCFLSIIGTKAASRNLKDVLLLPSQRNPQPYRTGYHFQPPRNWMNDPNGPMIYKGVYHLFYQYNPCNATFGDTIIWGHAVSYDLVNWTHLDPAIYPTDDDADRKSCWSGSATILPTGNILMLYTGSDSKSRQVQDLAWPKDLSDPFLKEWEKYPGNPILTPPDRVADDSFRDPSTAWIGPDGMWRMVVGADQDNNGKAFLYKSTDFKNWTSCKQPLWSEEATGTWECPDFYPVSLNSTNGLDTSMYNGSVMHVMKAGFEGHDWYMIGTYTHDGENFIPQNKIKLSGSNLDLRYDYGNFYASKSFFDHSKNRRVLWGWIPESDSQKDDTVTDKGWAGLMSFPRAVWMDKSGKQLIQWPVEEIEALRENEVKLENKRLDSANPVYEIQGITASQADITISFKLEGLTKDIEDLDTTSVDPQVLCTERGASSKGAFGPFGLLAMASEYRNLSKDSEEQTAIFFRVFYDQNNNRYSVLMCSDLSGSTVRSNIDKTSYGAFVDIDLQNNNEISLRNLIDHSIIESFAEEGKTCITSRVYPKFAYNEDAHLFAFNNGNRSVTISKMSAWSMKDAKFEIDQTEKDFCKDHSLSLYSL